MNVLKAYKLAREAFRGANTLRKRRKRRKLEQEGVVLPPKEDKPVKEFLTKKAKGALRSSTVGVTGIGTVVGSWLLANPEVWDALPDWVKGSAFIIYGIVLVVARLRTAGR